MSENIHAIFRVTCQDLKDGVWCALNERKIIWPCFFSSNSTLPLLRYVNSSTILLRINKTGKMYCYRMQQNARA